MAKKIITVAAMVALFALALYAHSGRTDANGGHRDSKTGTYHYHSGSGASTQSAPPVRSPSPPRIAADPNPYSQSRKIAPTTPIVEASSSTPPLPVISENHWQVALNNKHFKGKLEVTCDSGRIDISTDSKVVEVERVSKYKEGFEQAKKYAKSTGKIPVLALFIDGDPDGLIQLEAAQKESAGNGIQIVLANCLVSTNDLLALLIQSKTETGATEYWLTTSSGVRHNAACRWFKISNGRLCSRDDGRPCSICGG